jgi:uncharacterized protein YkwD
MGGKLAGCTLAVLALVALVGAPVAGAAPVLREKQTLEANVIARMNAVRRNHGLHTLRVVKRLTTAADRHAGSTAAEGYFSHDLFTPDRSRRWTPFGTWIRWYWPGPGYSSWGAGENLAWGAPGLSASATVSRWMASPGHRANILNPQWRNVGVAAVHVTNPRGYFAQWDDATIVAAEFGVRR